VQVLHPPQKFESPPFWNGWIHGITNYGVEVTFNDMTSLPNFIKIYQLVQKLMGLLSPGDQQMASGIHRLAVLMLIRM
jgi:hypothetical protein